MQNCLDFEIIEKRKTKSRKVKVWTQCEDKLLKRLHQEHPRQWGVIASLIPERNQNQCLHRYRRLCQRGMDHTKNWSQDQDSMVQKLIKRVGKNWKLISEMIGSKTGKQIRERYINKLDPNIKKYAWTREEDYILIKCIKQFGSKWSQISKNIPGRPQNMIKNRYYSFIKKNYQIRDKQIKENGGVDITLPTKSEEQGNYKAGQQNYRIPSILEIEQQAPILKEIQNVDLIDFKTYNHFSEHDLFYLMNTR